MSRNEKSQNLESLTRSIMMVFGDNAPKDIIFIVDSPERILDEILPEQHIQFIAPGAKSPHGRAIDVDGMRLHFVTEADLGAK